MSLTFPLTFPDVGITRFDLRYRRNIAMSQSPFSYKQQVVGFSGGMWEAEVTLAPLSYDDARPVDAFLLGLEGRLGTFQMKHPNVGTHSGDVTLGVTPVNRDYIIMAGAGTLVAGQFFQITHESGLKRLYCATEEKTTGSGKVVNIQPRLREAITASVSMVKSNPIGLWRMATNEANMYIDRNGLHHYSFSCVEAV